MEDKVKERREQLAAWQAKRAKKEEDEKKNKRPPWRPAFHSSQDNSGNIGEPKRTAMRALNLARIERRSSAVATKNFTVAVSMTLRRASPHNCSNRPHFRPTIGGGGKTSSTSTAAPERSFATRATVSPQPENTTGTYDDSISSNISVSLTSLLPGSSSHGNFSTQRKSTSLPTITSQNASNDHLSAATAENNVAGSSNQNSSVSGSSVLPASSNHGPFSESGANTSASHAFLEDEMSPDARRRQQLREFWPGADQSFSGGDNNQATENRKLHGGSFENELDKLIDENAQPLQLTPIESAAKQDVAVDGAALTTTPVSQRKRKSTGRKLTEAERLVKDNECYGVQVLSSPKRRLRHSTLSMGAGALSETQLTNKQGAARGVRHSLSGARMWRGGAEAKLITPAGKSEQKSQSRRSSLSVTFVPRIRRLSMNTSDSDNFVAIAQADSAEALAEDLENVELCIDDNPDMKNSSSTLKRQWRQEGRRKRLMETCEPDNPGSRISSTPPPQIVFNGPYVTPASILKKTTSTGSKCNNVRFGGNAFQEYETEENINGLCFEESDSDTDDYGITDVDVLADATVPSFAAEDDSEDCLSSPTL